MTPTWEDADKLFNVVKSAKTKEQVKGAWIYLQLYQRKHHPYALRTVGYEWANGYLSGYLASTLASLEPRLLPDTSVLGSTHNND
jgi:hypothetical protein